MSRVLADGGMSGLVFSRVLAVVVESCEVVSSGIGAKNARVPGARPSSFSSRQNSANVAARSFHPTSSASMMSLRNRAL